MNIVEAERDFANLVDKVHREGISIDLERDNRVVARRTPPGNPKARGITVGELNAFLRSLPSLGDDAEQFAEDVRQIRKEFPREVDPWD